MQTILYLWLGRDYKRLRYLNLSRRYATMRLISPCAQARVNCGVFSGRAYCTYERNFGFPTPEIRSKRILLHFDEQFTEEDRDILSFSGIKVLYVT